MLSCSNPECDQDFGYEAGMEEPPNQGDGHITVTWNPNSIAIEEERFYCSVECLIDDKDNLPNFAEVTA